MKGNKTIHKIVDNLSFGIYKLPDYQRVKFELFIYGYICLVFFGMIIFNAFKDSLVSSAMYSVGLLLFVLMLINKSTLYQRLRMLNNLRNSNGNN
jgi:hypothetical protein